jgi:hypothetical protein
MGTLKPKIRSSPGSFRVSTPDSNMRYLAEDGNGAEDCVFHVMFTHRERGL